MTWSSWLTSLRALVVGGSRRRSARPHPRPCLEVECLEAREVLSGAPIPGYALIGGNLFHTIASQQRLIDTSVKSFTVVQNQVFDLQTNGNVNLLNSDGSGKLQISSGDSSLVSDATGNVFALNPSNGTVYEHALGSSTAWSPTKATGVSSLVSDATGNVFVLNPSVGKVYEHVLGGSAWNFAGATGVSSLVSDGTGNLFVLNAATTNVYEHTLGTSTGWTVIGNGTSMVSDALGNVYVLNAATTNVYEHTLGTSTGWTIIHTGVQAIAITNTGQLTTTALPTSLTFTFNSFDLNGGTRVSFNGAQLTLFEDGSYVFSGSFHDGGLFEYNVSMVIAIKDSQNIVYTFGQQGDVAGTFESGSRDFSWDVNGQNDFIKDNWVSLATGATGNAAAPLPPLYSR